MLDALVATLGQRDRGDRGDIGGVDRGDRDLGPGRANDIALAKLRQPAQRV
jgi:hypothetical protein